MPIVSTRSERSRQANGSFHVVERHLDDSGVEHTRTWFADSKTDIDARIAEHAAELEAGLADQAARQQDEQHLRAADEKLLAYVREQPTETLKLSVKLTDEEVAALKKRADAALVAKPEAEAAIRG